MSKLWLFVYIESHVTLHAKADAQKVNSLLLLQSLREVHERVLYQCSDNFHEEFCLGFC